jgi:hypothetical protein
VEIRLDDILRVDGVGESLGTNDSEQSSIEEAVDESAQPLLGLCVCVCERERGRERERVSE